MLPGVIFPQIMANRHQENLHLYTVFSSTAQSFIFIVLLDMAKYPFGLDAALGHQLLSDLCGDIGSDLILIFFQLFRYLKRASLFGPGAHLSQRASIAMLVPIILDLLVIVPSFFYRYLFQRKGMACRTDDIPVFIFLHIAAAEPVLIADRFLLLRSPLYFIYNPMPFSFA